MTDLSKLTNEELLALAQNPMGGSGTTAPIQAQTLAPAPGVTKLDDYNLGGLSNDQLLAMAKNSDPNMSGMEDFGRSVATGLERGVSAIPAMLGDARDAQANALSKAGVDLSGLGRSVDGAAKASMPLMLASALLKAAPNSQAMSGVRQSALGPDHDPQTTAGRYGQRVAEFAPMAAAAPETLLGRAGLAVAGGIGSRGAEDLAPEKYKGAAAALGGLLGGVGVGGVQAIAQAPQRALGRALAEATPAQIQDATDLMRRGASLPGGGVQVTPFEALGQVTGSNAAPRIQHFVENTRAPGSADVSAMFSRERPAQVRSVVQAIAGDIAPPTANPSMLGRQVQQAANTALGNVRQDINDTTRPLYDAARNQVVPDAEYASLAADPSYQRGLAAIRGDAELNGPLASLPDNSIGVVDAVKRQLGTLADAARPTPMAAGDNYLASLRDTAQGNTAQAARAASPEYAAALDQQAALRQANLEPLQAGPLGRVAGQDDLTAQLAELFGKSPPTGAANETSAAMSAIGPDLGRQLTAQHLNDAFNNSSRDLVGGPNSYAGSKFAKDIAGHAEQSRVLAENLRAVGIDPQAPGGVGDMLEAFRATGQRQAPGSGTAFNQEMRESLGMPHALSRGLGALTDPLEYGKALNKAVGGAMYKRQLRNFADLLQAGPEQAQAMLTDAQQANSRGGMLSRLLMADHQQERR